MASRDRLLDLLVTRATEGLSAGESDELARGLAEDGQGLGVDDLDLAAAAVYLSYAGRSAEAEPMPEALKRRIPRPGPEAPR